MIQIFTDYILESETKEFIEFCENNINKLTHKESNYWYKGIDILPNIEEFSFLKRINLKKASPKILRIHRLDEHTIFSEKPHIDSGKAGTLTIFLNDEFTGGELCFNNSIITPKKNQVLYFTPEEKHSVKMVTKGIRYTLICFMDEPISFIKKSLV
jgi:hypothetical protein